MGSLLSEWGKVFVVVVAFVVAGLLTAACVGSLIINTKVEIMMAGIRIEGHLVFVDVMGLLRKDRVGFLLNTRVE